eukprot:gene24579-26416_t
MLFQQGEYLPAGLAKEDEVLQYYLKNVNPDPLWAEDPVAIDPKDKDTPGVWSGVRLIDVLRLVNVENINDFPVGLFVRFASEHEKGGDKLPGGVYGTSIPLEKADVMLAYMYNGKLLTPDHGFPIRLI